MGNVKAVLRKKPNKDSQCPIAIRITHDRKSSFIYTGQYIEPKNWDEKERCVRKGHPNSKRLNNLILKKTIEANDKLLELESQETRVSSDIVKKHIKNEYRSTSFLSLANFYLENIGKSGKYTRLSSEKPMVKHFLEFVKGDIDFRDITEIRLRKFQSYLKETRTVSERTIVNHLVVIRTIFNLAIRDGLVDHKYYPFGKSRIVIKFPESVKIGLEVDEVKVLENLKLEEGSPQRHALNIWLLSFYFAGMRVSDVLRLKWSDFQNGRLFYSMGKNNKAGSLKIPGKAEAILNNYKGLQNTQDLIFSELSRVDLKNSTAVYKSINNADKKFNSHLIDIAKLASINKPLTMHIARHTFGNISGENIPIQMLQKLYRHTSITTTINYQSNFVYKDSDEALDSVVNF